MWHARISHFFSSFRRAHSLLERDAFFFFFIFLSLLVILFSHIWQLAELPRGLYVDESSIGLNAALIAQSGHDEHGVAWPVYFKAFGEYKNPLYIYVTALVFRVMGVSVFSLRLTSYIFFVLFLGAWLYLVQRLFPQNRSLTLYSLVAAGFLPWFFPLSRIAFEVISQLTLFILFLGAWHRAYEPEKEEHYSLVWSLLAGCFLGLFFYTYTTSRLLGVMLLGLGLATYFPKKYWLRHGSFLASLATTLLPLGWFAWTNPEALVGRLRLVSYWYDTSLSLNEKLWQFLVYLGQYWGPQYLFYQGDTLMRHHTGYGGELFVSVGVLAVLGVMGLLQWEQLRRRFSIFLLLFLCLSPLGAVVTWGNSALRSMLLGVMLLICSLYGWSWIQQKVQGEAKRVLLSLFSLLLCVEVLTYGTHYFTLYAPISESAFESYDFQSSLQYAVEYSQHDVVISERGNAPYAHLEFYRFILDFQGKSVEVGAPVAALGRCVIVSSYDKRVENEDQYQMTVFGREIDPMQTKCFEL